MKKYSEDMAFFTTMQKRSTKKIFPVNCGSTGVVKTGTEAMPV